jgi:hypothetical protein
MKVRWLVLSVAGCLAFLTSMPAPVNDAAT